MTPSEKNTKRVILALDQAYEKFTQLEDESTDEAETVAYRCYYTNIYESKMYVEQMQKEINRLNELLKTEQPKHGHWIEQEGFDSDVYYDCSVCGESWVTVEGTPEDNGMIYCPHCGAKMDEERTQNNE